MNIAHITVRAAACLLLAAASAHSSASASASAPQPVQAAADPKAQVPATTYRPALGYKLEAAPAASPDRQWKESNATVAATHSMSLTMKGMAPMSPVAAVEAQSGAAAKEGGQCMAGGKGMDGCCCKDRMKSAGTASGHEHEHKESP
jgi:hypothetical protein